MRLEAVDLSDNLVAAQRQGRLVLFVGAGVSVAAPSSLPTFEDMARRIGEESEEVYPGDRSTSPDQFLGQLKGRGVDVHLRVHTIINRPDSRPNSLHQALAALASVSNVPRIVTTNYDRHLSACLPEIEEFESPLLPATDEFSGIVYLHGSLSQRPEHLVVTKADFGRAYLSDGWAPGFLRRLFQNYVVLFIGYSHQDTLMEYMAAGLPSESQRYALCEDPDDDRWHELGIQSIGYPCHSVLPSVIKAWAERAQMTMLDHAEHIREIVEGVPSLSPEDESYLDEVIADPQTIGFFTDHARGLAWLKWVADRKVFQSIFEPIETVDEVGTKLGFWFCRHYVANPALSDAALRVIGERRSGLGSAMAARVLHVVRDAARERGFEGLHRWASLAVTENLAPGTRKVMWRLLVECNLARDRETFLLLFDRLAEPVPILNRASLTPFVTPSVDVIIKESYWFGKVWQRSVAPNLDDLATDLIPIIDRHLRLAHRLTLVLDDSESDSSALSSARTTIASQGRYDVETIDPLIDAARDTLDALLRCSPDQGDLYLSSWSRSSYSLLQRLAVHGWANRNDREPDQKIEWLIENVNLLDPWFHYDIVEYLRKVVPDVSDIFGKTLVAHLLEHESGTDPDTVHTLYVYLTEIVKLAPHLDDARESLAELQAAHPNWQPPDEPVHILPPAVTPLPLAIALTPDELHEQIGYSVPAALTTLTRYASSESIRELYAVSKTLQDTIKKDTTDGVALTLELVRAARKFRESDLRLVSTILGTWRSMPEPLPYEDIIRLLPQIWDRGSSIHLDGADSRHTGTWLYEAVNHWAGMTAELTLRSVAHQRSSNGDSRAQIPDTLRAILEKMLMGTDCASNYAQVIVASQLLFLFTVDHQWSRKWVLPLLDSTLDENRALRCWDGQLIQGSFNQGLLEAGLLTLYVKLIPLIDRLGSEACRMLYVHLADLALIDHSGLLQRDWLRRVTADMEVEHRVAWIRWITTKLRDLSVEDTEAQWRGWMQGYWKDRLESIPRELDSTEASALAEWPLTLGRSLPEAVEYAVQYRASLNERSRVLIYLDRSLDLEEPYPRPDYVSEYPRDVARLLVYLLSNTAQAYGSLQPDLIPVIRQLEHNLDHQQIIPLLNEGLRLGILLRDD